MQFRQLLPEARPVDELELLATLRERPAPVDRPYTAVNFVASADGHASFGGRSGALGDDGDRAMFHGLREQFDAVLAGTNTLRVERYGRILRSPERRARRAAAARRPEPLACIITRSGAVPEDLPLLAEPEARVALFTAAQPRDGGWRAQVETVRLNAEELTLTRVLAELRSRFGVESLLCEGGPSLFSALLHEGLVDELFLTLAPQLTGGGPGPPLSTGPELAAPRTLRLLWVLERDDSLYLRYATD
ncbi:MAG TPA: dihydrofolate reductase family protein [Solirubrobacteraceae bacterium]|nr:dihydrofolate reductase family protein [Solirubrobacteraceae bacterium]